MFTEALMFAPALIGLTVFGTLALVGLVWYFTRPQYIRVANKSDFDKR